MSVARIATRYAKSLIDLSAERNQLDEVVKDITSFKKVVENRDFYLLLKSPIISIGKKSQIFKELFTGKFGELTSAFLEIILRKGREAYLPEIADSFMEQYKIRQKISSIKLTSAAPITEAEINEIKSKLVKSSATSDQIEIETLVDPSILGGFILEFDDKLYDASVKHKLESMKKEFESNSYVKSF